MREAAMDAVRIMDLMVANNARTVLRSTLDLIIMEATVSSVVAMAITIMAVSSVLMVIVRMEIMKEENVLTVHHVSITMVENASSARLLQDIIIFRQRTADYNPHAKYSMKKQIEYKDVLTDPNEPIRLNKFLANAGICSRREADEFITAGVVSVNGIVVTELGTKVHRNDEVKFHDQPVNIERKVYLLLNKPKDCVTTSDDPQERKTVMDFVKNACKERIYPVGRLDRNTTGVLLLTNDGEMASKLTHPKYLKKKIYHVYCDKNVTKADLDQIVQGITLEDGEIHADAVSYASETDKSQVGIEIHSGKNRIVRRIFEHLGYKVIKLDRVYFAGRDS